MGKFVKLKLNHPQCKNTFEWRLIISNMDEVSDYYKFDQDLNLRTLLESDTLKDGYHTNETRKKSINKIVDFNIGSGSGKSALEMIARVSYMKATGMLKFIQQGLDICINESGGYCDLKGFMKFWDAEIIQELQTNTFAFPIEKEFNSENLVLENSINGIDNKLYNYLKTNNITYDIVNHIKEKDKSAIFELINKSKNIYIASQFLYTEQVENFLKIFLSFDRKNIFIMCNDEAKESLKTYSLYDECITKHNVIFFMSKKYILIAGGSPPLSIAMEQELKNNDIIVITPEQAKTMNIEQFERQEKFQITKEHLEIAPTIIENDLYQNRAERRKNKKRRW